MHRADANIIRAFVEVFSLGDPHALAPFLGEDVSAKFEDAGRFAGRRAVLAFWKRLFRTYVRIDVHLSRAVADGRLVIAELQYGLVPKRGQTTSVRAISIFEIDAGLIVDWVDHADLADVPVEERNLWRRLGADRW